MRTRRLVAAAVALLAVVGGLTACSSSGTNGASGSCHLEVLGRDRANKAEETAWQQAFTAFDKAYKCTVHATWKGDFTEVATNLNAAHLAGTQVDLVTTATSNYTMAQAGQLMDLSKIVSQFSDRFTAKGIADFSLGGHEWSMPYGGQSFSAWFYNKDIFKKYNIAVPTTYAEFVTAAQQLSSHGVTPIVQGGKDTWAWPMWLMQTLAQTTDNTSIATLQSTLSNKGSFTDAQWVKAFSEIKQFASDKLVNSNALDIDGTGALAEIAQGKAAMTYNGSWTLASARAAKLNVGIFKFPLMDPTSTAISQPSGVTEDGLAIPSFIDPSHLKMASQLLEFLSRKQWSNKIFAPQALLIPAVKSATPASDPLSAEIIKDYQPVTVEWLDWVWPDEVNNSIEQAVASVLFSHQSPTAATKAVQAAFTKVKAQSKYQYDWWNHWNKDQWKSVTPTTIPKVQVKS
jgi:ABC-type glycerol-3-phosphate transport system substrate-binding protein